LGDIRVGIGGWTYEPWRGTFYPEGTRQKDELAYAGALLPDRVGGLPLRHAFQVRHESFRDPAFTALMKKANAAIVFADRPEYPCIDEATADFSYARLMKTVEHEPLGYTGAALDGWADRVRQWARRGDAFVFFISGAKVRAPAAARALIERVKR
jgi:uncharacterized protein YecE (DUF72 family)